MKRWNYSKKLMTAVCLMFASILSLCSINVLNYTNLNTTTIEEVADDALNDDSSFNENLGEEENAETSDETSEEVSQGNENETNSDDGTIPPGNDTENTTDTSEEDDLDDVATAAVNISTEEQLESMSYSGNYRLTGNIRLTDDWRPISFGGTFDGNGYTISGINISSSSNTAVGFFSTLSGATIKNTIFEGDITLSASFTAHQVGGIAGISSNSTIEGCWNKMDIHVYGADKNDCCGGIVGNISGGEISNCISSGSISMHGDCYIGGIAGVAGSNYFDINNCLTTGSLGYGGAKAVGGIMGYAEIDSTSEGAYIENCISDYISIVGGTKTGGIVGGFGEETGIFGIGNDPTGHLTGCINNSWINGLNESKTGEIGGEVDTTVSNCFYTSTGSIAFGNSHRSVITNVSKSSSFTSAMTSAGFSYTTSQNISSNWFAGDYNSSDISAIAIQTDFLESVAIRVQIETENGEYITVANNSSAYGVGYRSDLSHYNNTTSGGKACALTKSIHESTLVSGIIENSNGKYKYVGMFNPNDVLLTDETSYSANTYDMPNVINVRFDLDEKEINVNVYYSEELSFGGEIPNTIYSGTEGGTASLTSSSTGESASSGSSLTVTTVDKDWILIEASAKSGYELVGLFAGNAGDSRSQCVNILNNGSISDDVLVTYSNSGNLDLVEYMFINSNITSGGEMLTEYSVVFARYQYSGISLSQSYETEGLSSASTTTSLTYGFASRSLAYTSRARTNNTPTFLVLNATSFFEVYELNLAGINTSSSNPYFVGERSWYVGECNMLDFYWGGVEDQEFNFKNVMDSQLSNLGIYTVDEGGSLPHFTVNLNTYFRRYAGTTRTSGVTYIDFRDSGYKNAYFNFKEYSVNLDEKRGGETRIYDLYIVDGYEDIQTGEYTYGELGGTTNIRRNGRNLSKIDIYLDNGVLSDAGTNAKAFAFTNFIIDYYYEFVYDSRSPFDSHFYDENYGDDYLERAEKVSDTAISAFTEATNATISKTVNYGFNDAYGYDYRFADDHASDSGYDLSQNSVLELIDLFSESESSVAQENIENFNIVLFSKFAINSYNLTVQLDSAYSAYSGSDSPFSVSVNGVMQTAQNDSTNKFVINNIRAYSEIEIIINDIVFFNTSGSTTYQVYTYDSISNGSTFMANQDSYHFQIIPEENGALINYRVNYNLASSFNSSYISSDIERVGNTWYIDEASDFYYLYYLNLSQGEDFSGIRLVQTENIDFGGAYIIPLGYSVTAPFSGYYDGQYYTISDFNINMGNATDVGFFGFVDGAEIKNVTLLDGTVSGNSYVGGVVGYALSSTLTRLGNYSVEVSSTGREASNNIFVYTSSNSLVALNADNVGSGAGKYDVNVDELMKDLSGNIAYTTSSQSSIYVGGFAGGASNTSFDTCFSRGEVDSDATTSAGFVGGTTSCSLSYCYTTLSTFAGSGTIGSHNHATNGKDIVDEVCSTCADRFIW